MIRRFEYVTGSSSKFWEVETDGRQVKVRYGRIGANGQSQTKSFTSEAAADEHAKKQIAAKLAKGYCELAVA